MLYHLEQRAIEHAVLPWCEAHGVAVVAYSPFGHGHFPGPRTKGGRVLREIAAAHGATPRQVALRFLVRRPSLFAIPKASSPDHAAENAGAGDLRLTEAELARIDEAFPPALALASCRCYRPERPRNPRHWATPSRIARMKGMPPWLKPVPFRRCEMRCEHEVGLEPAPPRTPGCEECLRRAPPGSTSASA